MIKLGNKVRDKVTGFLGIVTARVEYMYGAPRLRVEAQEVATDGKPITPQWEEETRYVVLEEPK